MSEMHNMQKHNQTLSLIEVTRNNHYQDKLRKEYYSLQKKSQELFKAGKVLNWVDGGVALATIALAVGAFATGGLTLWSGIAVGALSVAGGSTTISSGVLKFQGSKMEGKMFLRQEEVSEIARASKLAIDDSIEAVNQLPKIYRTAMQLNDAEHRLKKFE